MDKYERILLEIISNYNNSGEYPRIGYPTLDRRLWKYLTEEERQTIPIGEKLEKLVDKGLIKRGNENGIRHGYYITEMGLNQLKEK